MIRHPPTFWCKTITSERNKDIQAFMSYQLCTADFIVFENMRIRLGVENKKN